MTWRAVLFALLLVWLSAAAAADGGAVIELREAQVMVEPYSATPVLPGVDADWRSLRLTQQIDNPSLQLTRVWFRMSFRVDGPIAGPWAVLLPRLYSGGRVFLNGLPVGEATESSPVDQAHWLRPHVFQLPVAGLREGENTLLVGVASRYIRIGIVAPLVGPENAIRPVFEHRTFWEYTMAQVSIWFLFCAALFLLAIWFWQRQEIQYGIFGLGAFAWGLRTINYVWAVVPLDIWIPWRAMYVAGTGFGLVLLCIFILRAGGLRLRRLERFVVAYTALGPLAALVTGHGFQRIEMVWYAGLLLYNLFAALVLARLAWQRRTASAAIIAAPPAMIVAAFLRDYATKADWLPFGGIYVAHVVAPAVVLAMGLVLLMRFIQALRQVENANVELERRLREREAEIARNHEEMMRLELAQASTAERQRIVQDMHDGLGSQLLTSLAMVERGAAGEKEIAQMLRECIDDMRLVLDALSPDDNDVLAALGTLRFRMAPRLAAAGITLDWRLSCPVDMVAMEPRQALAILRIVQEAITNALRHSGATTLTVAVDVTPDTFALGIADDGKGFVGATASAPAGRGLAHMRKRAAGIGAALDIASSPGGTEIRLRMGIVAPSGA